MKTGVNVVVGAGQAGANAAVAMREAGFAGRIVLVGDEPHHPYERPPLSKAALLEEPAPPPAWVFQAARYDAAGIELIFGAQAVALDAGARRLGLADGRQIAFDRLLLATGGRPRTLSVPGHERIHYLRSLNDAHRLRLALQPGRRVVCIGAGVIGLETAASAKQRGCAVTVLEAAPTALGRGMHADIAAWIVRLHARHDVAIHLGAAVAEVTEAGVLCADGAFYPADVVVAGVGMLRNTELAERAGLAVDGGIVVDALCRTSADGIYAAGDVTAFWHPVLQRRLRPESWKHAQNHGVAAGRAMADAGAPYDDVAWYWTDQYGVTIQVAGLVGDATHSVARGDPAGDNFSVWHFDAAGRLVAASGVNAGRDIRVALTLIGRGAVVPPELLADPATKLQGLLKA